jgi:hypothetical protein
MKRILYFFIFFSYNLPAGTLSSVLKIKFCAKFLSQILDMISVRSTPSWEKERIRILEVQKHAAPADPDPVPDTDPNIAFSIFQKPYRSPHLCPK